MNGVLEVRARFVFEKEDECVTKVKTFMGATLDFVSQQIHDFVDQKTEDGWKLVSNAIDSIRRV